MARRRVEVLTVADCPSSAAAHALVERVVAELRADAEVASVAVDDSGAAERLRFLGSPTIRVNGADVEPGADARREYSLACRVYRTEHGRGNLPEEAWIRAALAGRHDATG